MRCTRRLANRALIVALASDVRRGLVSAFISTRMPSPRGGSCVKLESERTVRCTTSIAQHVQAKAKKRRRLSSESGLMATGEPRQDERFCSTATPYVASVNASFGTRGTVEEMNGGWTDLKVPPEELRPSASLTIGQCFNWRQATPHSWIGVLGREVVAIRETPSTTLFRRLNIESTTLRSSGFKNPRGGHSEADLAATLRDYFFLEEPLAPLYKRWSDGDPRMAIVAHCITGVRVVRQDPVECLFSFICSSNNNIPRITLMLDKLRRTYGELLLSIGEGGLAGTGLFAGDAECEDWARLPLEFHSFPTAEALATRADEADLRTLGFGYRAKYIVDSAMLLREKGGMEWALAMRSTGRECVRNQLVTLSGVGPKVADCVALFSLDQTSAIPVDVHVWRIACRDFDTSLTQCKSLTPSVYSRVGDLFRDRFGPHAGWAHSLLFAAELPHFKDMLPPEMQLEMDDFRRNERTSKATAKVVKARKTDREPPAPTKKEKSRQRA